MSLPALLPLIMLTSLFFIPESPVWYIRKGEIESARKALEKINHGIPSYTPEENI